MKIINPKVLLLLNIFKHFRGSLIFKFLIWYNIKWRIGIIKNIKNKLLKFIKIEKQTGILLIEHDMSVVLGISDHVVVLNYGKKIFEGTADQTKNSKEVIEAYLGVDE